MNANGGHTRALAIAALALLAFAANSLLCRAALATTAIDAATFTTIRLVAGAVTLALIALARRASPIAHGSWRSALALFAYAAAFSFAYRSLTAATGALLLFGAVQVTMIAAGLRGGERPRPVQGLGFVAAIAGIAWLLLPGATAPPLAGAALMIVAGIAWGVYSLRGRAPVDPIATTAGNFVRAVPFALVTSLACLPQLRIDDAGATYAVLSGAIASGLGYAIWYTALPRLPATTAATMQLAVPVITALAGVAMLGERPGARLVAASVVVLGGIGLVIADRARR